MSAFERGLLRRQPWAELKHSHYIVNCVGQCCYSIVLRHLPQEFALLKCRPTPTDFALDGEECSLGRAADDVGYSFFAVRERVLWKQYELQIGLYKEYLNLLLKFNVFYYAATGALLSYYFSKQQAPLMKYSLLFPVLMSLGFASLFFYGASQIPVVREELFRMRDLLGLETAPEYRVLTIFLVISASLMLIVGVALLMLFFKN